MCIKYYNQSIIKFKKIKKIKNKYSTRLTSEKGKTPSEREREGDKEEKKKKKKQLRIQNKQTKQTKQRLLG